MMVLPLVKTKAGFTLLQILRFWSLLRILKKVKIDNFQLIKISFRDFIKYNKNYKIEKMKIIGLLSCGRSGADLFQSLLDSHEEILQFPGYLIFDSKLFNILSITNKREIAKKFCEEYPQFFDSRINITNSVIERMNILYINIDEITKEITS